MSGVYTLHGINPSMEDMFVHLVRANRTEAR